MEWYDFTFFCLDCMRWILTVSKDDESETASLASSILKFRQENGRSYHAYKAGSKLFRLQDCYLSWMTSWYP